MIASSKSLKIAALGVAAALHVGFSHGFAPDVQVELESTTGAAQAAIGTSFADMSKGVMTAKPVETEAEPIEPTADLPDTPDPKRISAETPVAAAATPKPLTTKTADILPTLKSDPKPVETARPVRAITPAETLTASSSPTGATLTATPAEPSKAQSADPAQRITARAPEQTAPTASKRPKRRDPAKEIKLAAKPKVETPATPKPQAKGNTNRNTRKGAATGQKQAKAAVQGTKSGKAKTSGNAAASNYPGKVMRRLARVKKVRGVGRGKAEVAFKIAANGGLAGASLRRSSGSGAFDRAAVRAVQRAAPFPPPPAGAQRSFKILITGS